MSFWNHYPYTDFHEINLDWIIGIMKEMEKKLDDFVATNSIKYANPFQWSIVDQYEKNTLVIEPNTGTAYLSVQAVPQGVNISNTDYWTPVFDLSTLFVDISRNFTGHDEQLNVYSSANYAVGDWLLWKNKLYKVTVPINTGAALSEGVNIERITVETAFNDLKLLASPEMFGAVGDGVTNDSAAINAALQTVKTLYIKNDYLLTTPITIPEGVNLVGPGKLIFAIGGYNAIIVEGNNTIDGIEITDNLSSYDSGISLIYGDDVKNVTVSNCNIHDIHFGYAVRFDKSQFIEIKDNIINEYGYAGIMLVNGCYDVDIIHNEVINSNDPQNDNCYPISLSGYFLESRDCARRITCNYNHISESTPIWEGIDAHGAVDVKIIGNVIEGTKNGVMMGSGPTSAPAIPESNKRIVICNNEISTINPSGGFASGIIISGNTSAVVDPKAENIKISNNKISITGTPLAYTAATAAIAVRHDSNFKVKNVSIDFNIINCENTGIMIDNYGASAELVNTVIESNEVSGQIVAAAVAISLRYVQGLYKNVSVKGNTIKTTAPAFDARGTIYDSANLEMIKYVGNDDSKRYGDETRITTPRTTLSLTHGYGQLGDEILDLSGTGSFWFCKAPGSWVAM